MEEEIPAAADNKDKEKTDEKADEKEPNFYI